MPINAAVFSQAVIDLTLKKAAYFRQKEIDEGHPPYSGPGPRGEPMRPDDLEWVNAQATLKILNTIDSQPQMFNDDERHDVLRQALFTGSGHPEAFKFFTDRIAAKAQRGQPDATTSSVFHPEPVGNEALKNFGVERGIITPAEKDSFFSSPPPLPTTWPDIERKLDVIEEMTHQQRDIEQQLKNPGQQ